MPAMAPVHKDVQQRARQDEEQGQIGDGGRNMRAVLRYEEISCDREESDEDNIDTGREKSASFARGIAVIHRFPHRSLRTSHNQARPDIP
jgi:hypothetical protein